MSSSLLLPNPCLLGILFTISTHDGNHLLFHYPPRPNEYGFQATPLDINGSMSDPELNDSIDDEDYDDLNDDDINSELMDELSTDDTDSDIDVFSDEFANSDIESSDNLRSQRSLSTESSIGDGRLRRTSSISNNKYQTGRDLLEMVYDLEQRKKKRKLKKLKQKQIRKKEQAEIQSLKPSSNAASISESNAESGKLKQKEHKIHKLFSFDIDFISDLATPPKTLCNTRFEITVEDMVFLGLPIHVNEDGSWRVSKKSKRVRSKSVSTAHQSRKQSVTEGDTKSPLSKDENRSDVNEETYSDVEHKIEDVKAYEGDQNHENTMFQFNMLFVMNPPVVEYNHRIDEMFHYIISRISLLLRYEQQKNNYVWKESQNILKLREELKYLPIKQQWKSLIEQSSLCKLIYETYTSVSKSEIVNIEINGKVTSFQIPIKKEFMTLPPSYVELPESSTLSSISPFNQKNFYDNDSSIDDTMHLYALILLDDTEKIIKDIQAEKDSLIASFIRMIKPSESLQRLSVLSGLNIQEVKLFANHLVYWRRAIAILPLTSRNIYVPSPIAPIKMIYKDSAKFNQSFPNLPSLPTFLSMISDNSSNKPKSIMNIIPSKDHRDLYMDAVSWLLKHGYVIQLYTFIYVKITKDIKIQVAEEIEIELKRKQEMKRKPSNPLSKNETDQFSSAPQMHRSSDESKVEGNNDSNFDQNDFDESVGEVKYDEALAIPITDDTLKHSSEDNKIEDNNINTVTSTTSMRQNENLKIQFVEEEEEDTILLEPESCSALERRWIAAAVVKSGASPTETRVFYRVLKHLNGRTAQETFLAIEGVGRMDMKHVLDVMSDYLVVVRHW
ncbi:hypothetical protein CANINC_002402 [Pichia inconspicua]|uniref:Nitrogen permease regulator 3 n=1 Tax=Pichia inconspicua TaxID=52247 RepID=A0A4T0X1K9_9ASCO|nr:hypothetical protein CANINC_002402 [[Candida] inconspicua]